MPQRLSLSWRRSGRVFGRSASTSAGFMENRCLELQLSIIFVSYPSIKHCLRFNSIKRTVKMYKLTLEQLIPLRPDAMQKLRQIGEGHILTRPLIQIFSSSPPPI